MIIIHKRHNVKDYENNILFLNVTPAFDNAITQDGLISVLRQGFKHRGISFRICYFKAESELNETAVENYKKMSASAYDNGIIPS